MQRFDQLFSLYMGFLWRITLISIRILHRVPSLAILLLSKVPKSAYILVNSMATTPLASTPSTNILTSTPLLTTSESA
ncbi:hypothetical protein AAHA92_10581 [Salvia divinorum]|uniref:Uncharacterized protein n=1 Tax=Salvia divinorum TaxID=28513 RepID=A0ABD1HYI6_SALDI